MSPYPQTTSFTSYSFTLNKGGYPCQVVISINKYWLLPNLIGVENSPVTLKTVTLSIGFPTWQSGPLYLSPCP